jgi:hypothetical protein
VSVAKLGAGIEESAPDARAEAIEAAIEAGETAFDRHKDDLLDHLQKVCNRTPKKSFDPDESWKSLRLMAWIYFRNEATVAQDRKAVPAADRVKLLRELGNALREARCKLEAASHHDLRGAWFVEWCVTHGDPDLLEFLEFFENQFDKCVADVVAGLADLETAASRASEGVRRKSGRPGGTSVLQHDFIINLEATYRHITGKPGRVGPGPFAQFVDKFLEAVGRRSKKETVIRAIKAAKKREQKDPATSRWGREDPVISRWMARMGEIPPNSP